MTDRQREHLEALKRLEHDRREGGHYLRVPTHEIAEEVTKMTPARPTYPAAASGVLGKLQHQGVVEEYPLGYWSTTGKDATS
jgi:hypothetical protein